MNIEKIIELIRAVSASELTAFKMKKGELEIYMETAKRKAPVVLGEYSGGAFPERHVSASVQVLNNSESMANAVEESHKNVVKSPLVGTFYRASAPENPPYVQVGDIVKKGQVLGIVEAMKLMNEIESEFDGTVKEICIENEQMVEFGQPLFVIE